MSSSDICDEMLAIDHQETKAGKAAAKRISAHDWAYHWQQISRHSKAPSRVYEPDPQSTPETASADPGWGENATIQRNAAAALAAGGGAPPPPICGPHGGLLPAGVGHSG